MTRTKQTVLPIEGIQLSNYNGEIHYKVDGETEILKVKKMTIANLLELRRMFNAFKLIIEKEGENE